MRICPECKATIQRTMDGTIAEGMSAHYRVVHPGVPVPIGGAS